MGVNRSSSAGSAPETLPTRRSRRALQQPSWASSSRCVFLPEIYLSIYLYQHGAPARARAGWRAERSRTAASSARARRAMRRRARRSLHPPRHRSPPSTHRSRPGSRTWQRPHMARPPRASAEPLRGCAGQPCALRAAPRLDLSTHIQYASTALFCDLGWRQASCVSGRPTARCARNACPPCQHLPAPQTLPT